MSSDVTSQILDEVLKFHFSLRFDIWTIHVSVEEDDGKGQDENGVWVLELSNQCRITHTVSLTVHETKTSEKLNPETQIMKRKSDRLSLILKFNTIDHTQT